MDGMDGLKTEYAIASVRVSSSKQGLQGDSTDDQRKQIEIRVSQVSQIKNSTIKVKKWFEFIESASGELEMQPILKALEYCKDPKNKIKYFFFKTIDRGTRGGAIIYGELKALFSRYGVQLVDVHGVIGTQTVNTLEHLGIEYKWSKYSPTFITELLEAERAHSDVRDILTRLIGAEIRYVQMGYRVRPAPPGYINEKTETPHGMRVILKPHPLESAWFIRMFELRIQGHLTDEEIVKNVNDLGYRSRKTRIHDPNDKTKILGYRGEKKLTIKQFQRYIINPIYAGVNTEKWSNGKPIKMQHPGLVTIDMFNRANKGKITIIENGQSITTIKGKPKKWQLVKKRDNPLYPYKQQILCPVCRKPLLGSSPRSKSGKHIATYHCARKHKYWGINAGRLEETVSNFVHEVRFTDKFKNRFTELVLEDLEKREKQLSGDTISLEKLISEKGQEIQSLKDTIKRLTSQETIRLMEDDIEKLLLEKAQLMESRGIKEVEQIDIQIAVNYCRYYMEHLEDLILGSEDPLQNAAMFGLVFNSPPTYKELKNGTPNLASIFKLNQAYQSSNSLSVSHNRWKWMWSNCRTNQIMCVWYISYPGNERIGHCIF